MEVHFLNRHHKVSSICISLKLLFFYLNNLSFSNFYPPNMNLVIHIILIKGNNGTTIFLFYSRPCAPLIDSLSLMYGKRQVQISSIEVVFV